MGLTVAQYKMQSAVQKILCPKKNSNVSYDSSGMEKMRPSSQVGTARDMISIYFSYYLFLARKYLKLNFSILKI